MPTKVLDININIVSIRNTIAEYLHIFITVALVVDFINKNTENNIITIVYKIV